MGTQDVNPQKEIGGYFSLECGSAPSYYGNGVFLNSGRNALRYIIRLYGIRKIAVPYYTCPVVWQAVTSERCTIVPYDLDRNFFPLNDFDDDTYVVYNNYFGVFNENVRILSKRYKRLIVDNAQAFYSGVHERIGFYSPRKFFGLPDGGIAMCSRSISLPLEYSTSYDSCLHLLKRHDTLASDAYTDFLANELKLEDVPVKQMSKLTKALMGNIDYERVRYKRRENFVFLHNELAKKNQLMIKLTDEVVPLVYPLMSNNDALRQKLVDNKIYVAKYWSAISGCDCMKSEDAQEKANSLVPLPIDQRYNLDDMKRILEVINEC